MNEKPLIIEMVGIAGAGKSTLRKVLAQRNPRIQAAVPPGKASYVPFLLRNTCRWLPAYLTAPGRSRWFTLNETQQMGYLETWAPYLEHQARAKDAVLVLDPGSVYWLSALREFGPGITRTRSYETWWDGMLSTWAAALDAIVWLDAPDDLLYQRVLTRNEWHPAQKQPQDEVLQSFVCLRKSYERIIAEMTRLSSPRVLQFRTDQILTSEMADRVLALLHL